MKLEGKSWIVTGGYKYSLLRYLNFIIFISIRGCFKETGKNSRNFSSLHFITL